ncbi:unnamed protein product [Rotaria magnacalcarata]|uniref:Uncharacterized protein n=2 Tax=Rotaria magnacalcarata TaxID=392030 RepID=A0A816SPM4_9BILA|nr:unnamed protein product [Rotaria magnacalcarata]CAF1685909.1 unnamed protein product [Rotaria magnacalcarata]CAF2088079.1 unnamed protein product [Rotaria magnacalcarata]CAF2107551.1 unnamed protein product [Rotaria magnacalcarata]
MRIISECSLSQDIRGISDDIQMSEIVLQKNVRLGPTELHLLAIVELQAIHVYDKPHVVILSNDSGKIRDSNKSICN